VTSPNFLVIGAARSGTSALTHFVSQHPDVYVCEPKEVHFLAFADQQVQFRGRGDDQMMNRSVLTDPAEYFRLFEGKKHRAIGEGSVSTLYYAKQSIANIRKYLPSPNLRLIVVLRNPIERAYSSYLYMRAMGFEQEGDFLAGLDREASRIEDDWHHIWHYTKMGYFSEQLAQFHQAFADEQILTLLHEDMELNPQNVLSRVFRHIGVDDSVVIDSAVQINGSGVPRSDVFSGVLGAIASVEWLSAAVRAVVPLSMRHAIRQANLSKPVMPADARDRLVRLYADEIDQLGDMLGRDLSHWLEL